MTGSNSNSTRSHFLPTLLATALLATFITGASAKQMGGAANRQPIDREAERVSGRVIVKFAANAAAQQVNGIIAQEALSRLGAVGRTGALLLGTQPGRELDTIDRLLSLPIVEYAEPD